MQVIVSLTTTPWRIQSIEPVLRNLLFEQTFKPTKVHLYLSLKCGRDQSEYILPDFLYYIVSIILFGLLHIINEDMHKYNIGDNVGRRMVLYQILITSFMVFLLGVTYQ